MKTQFVALIGTDEIRTVLNSMYTFYTPETAKAAAEQFRAESEKEHGRTLSTPIAVFPTHDGDWFNMYVYLAKIENGFAVVAN